MTAITYIGIELSARTQFALLGMEIFTLTLFAVVALVKVATMDIAGEMTPSLDWFNPIHLSSHALAAGMIFAIFIYWGWDSTVTVNEESADATEAPGRAAVWSTVILVAIYVLLAIATTAYHGPDFLANDDTGDIFGVLGSDVLGSPLDKLLIIAVLTSASASTQTTILPTTRTVLSMAAKGAAPRYWAVIHDRYLTPKWATIWMGIISIVWYVGLKILSENILYDAIAALGLAIAFYYALTGFAAPIYYRRELGKSTRNLLMIGVAPTVGSLVLTWAFFKSAIDFWDPANSESGTSWLGVGPPFFLGIGMLVIGIPVMLLQRRRSPEFFRRRPEVADPEVLSPAVPAAPVGSGD